MKKSWLIGGMPGARGSYSSLVYACPKLMLRYFQLCEEGHPEAVEIGQGLQRLFREFVLPLLQEGFTDTAFDRTFATATGFSDRGTAFPAVLPTVRPPGARWTASGKSARGSSRSFWRKSAVAARAG